MDILWCTDRSSVVTKHTNGDRWTIKTLIEIYLWSSNGLIKMAAVDFDPPLPEDSFEEHYVQQDLGDGFGLSLSAEELSLSITDVEATDYDEDGFDDDAKQQAVAAIANTTHICLQHQPVFKLIRDFLCCPL